MRKRIFIIKLTRGFTLVEMAIVLVILGFVLSTLLLPLQAQREQVSLTQTNITLGNAKQALLGYAQAHGRLPCPATALNNTDAGSQGQENPLGGTHNVTPPNPAAPNCAVTVGFLPAATLGIEPSDANGFALDAWNNRIRYAITADESSGFGSPRNNNPNQVIDPTHPACAGDSAPDFTTTGNMAVVSLVCLAPNLRVCRISPVTDPANCNPNVNLTNNAVAVIYSTGATGAQGSAGRPDELANLDGDTVFVSHDISLAAAPNEFDHLVTWISPFVLYNEMIQAGQLH